MSIPKLVSSRRMSISFFDPLRRSTSYVSQDICTDPNELKTSASHTTLHCRSKPLLSYYPLYILSAYHPRTFPDVVRLLSTLWRCCMRFGDLMELVRIHVFQHRVDTNLSRSKLMGCKLPVRGQRDQDCVNLLSSFLTMICAALHILCIYCIVYHSAMRSPYI